MTQEMSQSKKAQDDMKQQIAAAMDQDRQENTKRHQQIKTRIQDIEREVTTKLDHIVGKIETTMERSIEKTVRSQDSKFDERFERLTELLAAGNPQPSPPRKNQKTDA